MIKKFAKINAVWTQIRRDRCFLTLRHKGKIWCSGDFVAKVKKTTPPSTLSTVLKRGSFRADRSLFLSCKMVVPILIYSLYVSGKRPKRQYLALISS